MKIRSRFIALLLSLAISATLVLPLPALAQQAATPKTATTATDYSTQLAAIEKVVEEKRKEFGIPGASLVIVKDDKVIYLKGLGVKDFEKNVPVTPDTRFAIGSASKAFTAMLAVIGADEGKLTLDDSPKKFLPYFTLRDQEAASKITMRDLLAHRSGLNRTDLAMVTGVLNREELIKVAGMAKPTAKLGEKFQYQNVMYTAAGEAVAKSENSTWDDLIKKKIFKPLGMNNSDTRAEDMQKARDYSFGYDYNAATKVTRRLPQRSIDAAAPAGAINSSARDMAQWLRLMLGNGTLDGKRIVSEKGFDELIKKQVNIAGPVDYGLGWFLRKWNGHTVVEHGGNIDGFNAQVALMPDQKLGFVLLTNVTASSLGAVVMNTIWKTMVADPSATDAKPITAAADPKQEVGKYLLAAAGLHFEVSWKDDQLMISVPGQPSYPLKNIGGRRYQLGDPAPPGFYATFRPMKDKESETELFIEQPQGNVLLTKVKTEAPAQATTTTTDSTLISVDELLAKMIAALGGEQNLRKHKSSFTTIEIDLESQGVQGKGTVTAKAPNLTASDMTLTALGKKIGTIVSYFDGNNGGEVISFAPEETYSGKRLEDIRAGSDFYDILNWKNNYKITVKRMGKVGDEDAYIIERRNEKGTPITDYISAKSFLVLRRDSLITSETSGIELPQTQWFADYRPVDGVMVPFKQTSNNIANGDIVVRVIEVKYDVDIPDTVFKKPATDKH